jgi:hypothetical protein
MAGDDDPPVALGAQLFQTLGQNPSASVKRIIVPGSEKLEHVEARPSEAGDDVRRRWRAGLIGAIGAGQPDQRALGGPGSRGGVKIARGEWQIDTEGRCREHEQ